jgi:hypothetical protein
MASQPQKKEPMPAASLFHTLRIDFSREFEFFQLVRPTYTGPFRLAMPRQSSTCMLPSGKASLSNEAH